MEKTRRSWSLLASTFAISLIACGGGGGDDPQPPNSPPTVNAGEDQTLKSRVEATLSGQASDSDGSISTIAWTQIDGTNVVITNANMLTATFTTPDISQIETLNFRLTVTDDDGAASNDSVQITVSPTDCVLGVSQLDDCEIR